MANKFLGLDSVNVLKDYIDKQILVNNENTKIITVHAYKYVEDGVIPETPNTGSFDPEGANVTYPEGWSSLKVVLNNIGDNEKIEEALSKGAIWLSVGIAEGNIKITDTWSTPVKISGQNGVSVRFAYSYNDKAEESERSKYPKGPNSKNRTEWVWTKYADDEWQGPFIWAMYSTDASDVHWRYLVTSEEDEFGNPIIPNKPSINSLWTNTIPTTNISSTNPYMWMSWQRTAAGQNIDNNNWSDPILFGHYGQDGQDGKDGVDGNVPDYTLILYALGNGFTTPEKPVLPETNTMEDFRVNNSNWLDLPSKDYIIEEVPEEEFVDINSEEDLMNNIESGIALKLNEDINLSKALVITNNVKINLNGHTITGGLFIESNGEMLDVPEDGRGTDSYVFWVKDGGNLTIEGNGNVIAQEADYSMAVWCQGGTVTINGGNYYNGGDNCDLIYISKSGTVTINGGYFEATTMKTEGVGTGYKRSALNIKNADIDNCTFIVNGGEFIEFDPSNLDKEVGGITSFVSPNCISSSVDNKFIVSVDPTTVDPDIWWHCSIKVNGQTNEIIEIGDVYRYNAVDGNAKPGQFTKYVFYWSETQDIPNNLNDTDWKDTPSYDESNQEGSLWMKVTDVKIDATGQLSPLKPWSNPIKLTGPRGPIAYDYRIETRYNIGTSEKPKSLPTETEWTKKAPNTTSQYPYIWAVNYLMLYKMKYDDNGDIVTADNGKLLETYSYFRLSGINGEDGNRKNSLKYSNDTETIKVTSFSENNLYISNASADVTYEMNLDQLSFINGYTGKFANIGTGVVTINAGKFKFIGSCTESTTITLNPQESVELVCYNNDTNKELLVIGKSL